MKTMVAEEKNILDEISSRLDMAEEKYLKKIAKELENIAKETIQNEIERKKMDTNRAQSISGLWDNVKQAHLCITGGPKGEKRRGTGKVFEKNNVQKCPKLDEVCKVTYPNSSTNPATESQHEENNVRALGTQ